MTPTPEEKEVPGFPGFTVTSDGVVSREGAHVRQRISTPGGYPYVRAGGKNVTVHRMVALAFLGPRPPGLDINHVDGVKTNNRASNLEYVTRRENVRHAMRLGLFAIGARRHGAKLTDAVVVDARRRRRDGEVTTRQLCDEFGMTQGAVWRMLRGLKWSHVPGALPATRGPKPKGAR